GSSLKDMIRENLVAERVAIESYLEMIQYLGDRDPTTRRMLEGILAVEEEHADELADMLSSESHARRVRRRLVTKTDARPGVRFLWEDRRMRQTPHITLVSARNDSRSMSRKGKAR